MAAPTVTFNAGEDVFDFTEQTITTGSTFLHTQTHTAAFADDDTPLTFLNPYTPVLTYEYDPDPAQVPGSIHVFLQYHSTNNSPYSGTDAFTFSVEDKDLDYLDEGQTLTQKILATIEDDDGTQVDTVVTIKVHGKNDAPVANVDLFSVSDAVTTATVGVLGNDIDPDLHHQHQLVSASVASATGDLPGLDASLIKIAQVNHLNNNLSAKDAIQFTLDPAFQGLATGEKALITVNYTMTDEHGATSASQVKLTVVGHSSATIYGTNKADKHLFGEKDADTIYGNNGADVIVPRGGHDVIYGGAGKDKFVFSAKGDSKLSDPDDIKDFKHGDDKIDLSAFAGKFEFRGTDAFNGGHDIRYESKSGYLHVLIDTNGDKTADMAIDVYGASSLVVGDFVV